jgi:hypothetical protein
MKKAIITIFLFLIPLAVLASGELEVDYPSIPKTEDIENIEAGLPYYIKYIFNFSLWIVGILAFVLLIKTGFEYLTSAGNPSKLKETKDQMLAILLGIAILFGSTFILKTIDPSFTNLDIGEIETVETLPPPSPTQSISPDPLVRIRNLAKTTKDSIAPTLKDENKKLNPLVVKCNCIYTSSKCDCKSWTCTPVYGNGGGCPCKKFLESVLPGTPANIIGQALEGLNSSTVGQILSMVPGISSDDLTPSGFLGLPKEIQEKVKEALSNVENFKEVALSILGVEGSLDSLSGEDIYNFASNLFNLPEIDIEELFSETSGEKIKEFFSSLAQIPNPEDLISSFSEGNLEKIANSFINMSSGEIEETFSNFSPETIKEIATNLSGIDINNISNSLNENTIKELANKFLSLPKENIKNDISNLSKNDLINIISNISESNLEEAASILPDIDKEDLISNLSSLSEENLEEALSEILSLNGQSVLEDLPFKEIQKIASNISNGNIEDIIPLLPTSKIEEIAKEFINFSPETIKDYLPIDVLKKVAEGIFKLPSEILDKALSDLSKEDFLGMIKDFSKIDPGKIQEIISNLSEGDLKEILSSLSKEKLKEILEEGKIPFADFQLLWRPLF